MSDRIFLLGNVAKFLTIPRPIFGEQELGSARLLQHTYEGSQIGDKLRQVFDRSANRLYKLSTKFDRTAPECASTSLAFVRRGTSTKVERSRSKVLSIFAEG